MDTGETSGQVPDDFSETGVQVLGFSGLSNTKGPRVSVIDPRPVTMGHDRSSDSTLSTKSEGCPRPTPVLERILTWDHTEEGKGTGVRVDTGSS